MQKLMKMMQDHDKAGAPAGNNSNNGAAGKAGAAPPKNDSTEGESDSD